VKQNSFVSVLFQLCATGFSFCAVLMLTQENGDDDGLNAEAISQAKQSRSEKKARKAVAKLGNSKPPFTPSASTRVDIK